MKLLLTGDWHYTNKTPASRIDDYQQTLEDKIKYIFKIALEKKVDRIIQPGDFTDTPFLDYNNYIRLLNLISDGDIPIYTIFGQHDLKYRNKGNTPLDALHHSLDGFYVDFGFASFDICNMYGVSYGEEIPKIKHPNKFNILVIHKMLLHKKEEEWQEDYDLGIDFLNKHKFNLIVSGDNHQSFFVEKDKRFLINCGSLMRSTIEQIDHHPCFYIFDTKTGEYWQHMIPIKSWKECFDLEKKVKEEEADEKMKAFVSGLKTHKSLGLNFVDNLMTYMQKNNVSMEIQLIIKNNMGVKE